MAFNPEKGKDGKTEITVTVVVTRDDGSILKRKEYALHDSIFTPTCIDWKTDNEVEGCFMRAIWWATWKKNVTDKDGRLQSKGVWVTYGDIEYEIEYMIGIKDSMVKLWKEAAKTVNELLEKMLRVKNLQVRGVGTKQ
jgi:hypothetical protein